ncbi:MAG: DUF72 domain-containing protein [Kofleriaceae bacterium]
MTPARIGTVDLPERMERERYFRELSYLELSALFAGPLKPSALAKWAEAAPRDAIGLVAPWVLTHRQVPKAARLWPHDTSVGDFRDSAHGRTALEALRAAVSQLGATCAVFRSPTLFAPSAANRDQLRAFFGELATEEAVGAERVWVPDGLWNPRSAVAFATEIGVTCAIDPLVRDPGEPPEIYYDLDVSRLYLRIAGLGRTGPLRSERLDDLMALLEHYEDVPATIAFESPARWQDARNLKKLLEL